MNPKYVTCALCGHQFPAHFLRERGSLQCSCGMRMDAATVSGSRHHLRNVGFLLATALLLVIAASIGRHYLG